ncbi:MAG: hypothetical protein ACFBRM_06275 [Pikeienuella sp.]
MRTPEPEIFYVGYLPVPRRLRGFLAVAALILVAAFFGLGYAVSSTQRDPGDGAFRWDWGRQTVTGILRAEPYPTVTLTQASERFAEGQTLMLSGGGKRGVQDRAAPLDGQLVSVSGIALTRGDLDMIQVRGAADGLEAIAGDGAGAEVPADVALGRWRVTGEICDGKCVAGAMRPGRGLSHKACANLCLIGGVPPVFVATGEIEGSAFLLMAGPDGNALGPEILDAVARLVEVEGAVLRRGDLLILRIDPETLRLL